MAVLRTNKLITRGPRIVWRGDAPKFAFVYGLLHLRPFGFFAKQCGQSISFQNLRAFRDSTREWPHTTLGG